MNALMIDDGAPVESAGDAAVIAERAASRGAAASALSQIEWSLRRASERRRRYREAGDTRSEQIEGLAIDRLLDERIHWRAVLS